MKKFLLLFCVFILCLSMCSCVRNSESGNRDDSDLISSLIPSATTPTETEPMYGTLQEIVDRYGFPIHLRMTEGMELTEIVLSESTATREWMSSMVTGSILHENLSWSITEDDLIIYGEWEESFSIDIIVGRAYSKTDGKEYRIVTYDDNGEVEFYVE